MKIIKTKTDFTVPEGLTFFDIETTGLDSRSSYVYLIGFLKNINSETYLIQLFCEDFNEEKQLIKVFSEEITDKETLVHYNGTTFDIPYINNKAKRHCIDFHIAPEKSIDLYKSIMHFKKYLALENIKLVTVEKAAGYERTDTFSGGELIDLYAELTGLIRLASLTKKEEVMEKVAALSQVILQHNTDDILGLYKVFQKTNIAKIIDCNYSTDSIERTPFELCLSLDFPILPSPFELSLPDLYLNNGVKACDISFPIFDSELRYFFEDFQNYTYIIDRDCCMHNSIVSGIAKNNKKKCTAKTAYIKMEGSFICIPKSMIDYCTERSIKLFKECYESKKFYIQLSDAEKYIKDLCKYTIEQL